MIDNPIYLERWKIVRSLGFQDYKDYLQSELWSSIRRKVLRKASGKCSMCEGRANQVHHRKYTKKNLSGDSMDGLLASCEECHELLHKNAGEFVSYQESKKRAKIFVKSKEVKLKHKPFSKDFRVEAKCKKCGKLSMVQNLRSIKRSKCACGGGMERIR